jgi:3-oxoacyl-[acyl-carrier-protein] synthase II
MDKRRVVITGLGVVSSVGIGIDKFWKSIIEGKSGISKVTLFDTKDFRCHYAGEIKDFHPEKYITNRKISFLSRASQFAITATDLALKNAKISSQEFNKERTGVLIGTTMGEERPLKDTVETWVKEGFAKINKQKILFSTANNISSNVGIYFHLKGVNLIFSNACAAGNYAIGYGFDLIKNGVLDHAIAGGVDSFSKTAFSGFHRLYAMAPDKCQPFDKNRKGMMVGEGAGILILESLDSALKRNAEIYAEVLGYGLSCDAHHITSPSPAGVEKAIRKTLKETGLRPEDIDYINAHGTGTPANDKSECKAITNVFKEHSTRIPVSSIKSMLGHAMGAASAIEALTCCLAIRNDTIPPTINYETPDPDCNIDCVPNKARKQKINIVLKNSFAFGGNNCCVILGNLNRK